MRVTFAAALQAAERFAGQEPRRVGAERRTLCPFHETPGESSASLDIKEGKDGLALVQCRSKGCSREDIFKKWGFEPRSGRPIRARFPYRDAEGRELAAKLRFDDDQTPKMLWDRRLNGRKMPLYRLDSIVKARENGGSIYIAEGEKDVETLISLGFPAVCSPHGATEKRPGEKWPPEYTKALHGLSVVILQDNDEPGKAFAEHVSAELARAGSPVKLVPPFAGPKGFDVSDWIAEGHTGEELARIVESSAPFTSPTGTAEAAPTRSQIDGSSVNGAELLGSIAAFVRRFVVITNEQAVLIAVWILHTFAVEAFEVTPYLAVLSAEKRSGKSRLLEVLKLLVKSPWHAIQPSEAVLFRYIQASAPTLLLDETDALFTSNPNDRQEAVRALLNAGNRRGVTVPRCANHGEQLIHFETFCPKALAGIGKLPETVADRSFEIRMRRKKRTETAERFRPRDLATQADELKAQAEAWAAHHLAGLRLSRPALPDELGDRAQDSAEPLLAVADAAGGSWPKETRRALISLAGERPGDEQTIGIELLADCRSILSVLHRSDGHIRTELLLKELLATDGDRWKLCLSGNREPLTDRALAKILKPFEIYPKQFRDGAETPRGYSIPALLDAFERYLDPIEEENADSPSPGVAKTSKTAKQPAPVKALSVLDDAKQHPKHAFRIPETSDALEEAV